MIVPPARIHKPAFFSWYYSNLLFITDLLFCCPFKQSILFTAYISLEGLLTTSILKLYDSINSHASKARAHLNLHFAKGFGCIFLSAGFWNYM